MNKDKDVTLHDYSYNFREVSAELVILYTQTQHHTLLVTSCS